jgi:phosphinothricin acetyltransferase
MSGSIRLASPDDGAAVAAIYHPYVADTVISFEVEPPTEDDMRSRIAAVLEKLPWLVYEDDGRVVGYAYASAHRAREAYQWSVDVAVYVAADQHRRGIGRRLYGELFPALRRLGYVNAYAGITLPNDKSVGLHEAMGFVRVGIYRSVGFKLGQWRDVGWWHLPLQDPPADPEPPVALQRVLG